MAEGVELPPLAYQRAGTIRTHACENCEQVSAENGRLRNALALLITNVTFGSGQYGPSGQVLAAINAARAALEGKP